MTHILRLRTSQAFFNAVKFCNDPKRLREDRDTEFAAFPVRVASRSALRRGDITDEMRGW